MKNTIAIFLILFSITATADEWTEADTQRQITFLALDAMDWAQTRNISRNPDRWYETNVILGKHPSVDKVDAYFVSMAILNYMIASSLPSDYRAAFQYLSIGYESEFVRHNLSIGIGIKF